jgi:hypothetical protein
VLQRRQLGHDDDVDIRLGQQLYEFDQLVSRGVQHHVVDFGRSVDRSDQRLVVLGAGGDVPLHLLILRRYLRQDRVRHTDSGS